MRTVPHTTPSLLARTTEASLKRFVQIKNNSSACLCRQQPLGRKKTSLPPALEWRYVISHKLDVLFRPLW